MSRFNTVPPSLQSTPENTATQQPYIFLCAVPILGFYPFALQIISDIISFQYYLPVLVCKDIPTFLCLTVMHGLGPDPNWSARPSKAKPFATNLTVGHDPLPAQSFLSLGHQVPSTR